MKLRRIIGSCPVQTEITCLLPWNKNVLLLRARISFWWVLTELECLGNFLPPLPHPLHSFFNMYHWCLYVLTLDSHGTILLFSFFNSILTSAAIWTSSSYTISIYCPETPIKIQLHFCCNILKILFPSLAYCRFASSPEWMCWFAAITSKCSTR